MPKNVDHFTGLVTYIIRLKVELVEHWRSSSTVARTKLKWSSNLLVCASRPENWKPENYSRDRCRWQNFYHQFTNTGRHLLAVSRFYVLYIDAVQSHIWTLTVRWRYIRRRSIRLSQICCCSIQTYPLILAIQQICGWTHKRHVEEAEHLGFIVTERVSLFSRIKLLKVKKIGF